MRLNYIIYPEGEEKLQKSGLLEKIQTARKEDKLTKIQGYLSEYDLKDYFSDLKKFYKQAPKDELKAYQQKLNNMLKNHPKWKIAASAGEYEEEIEPEDLLVLGGWFAKQILNENEFWKPQNFGFENIYELFGTIGAKIQSDDGSFKYREGYKWMSKQKNGELHEIQITGDMHGDLRIFDFNPTPYKTTDPLGNNALFRPQGDNDLGGVWAYHSVEVELLMSVLKYIHQEKIDSAINTPEGRTKLLEEALQCTGNTKPFIGYADFGHGDSTYLLGVNFGFEIPKVDENYETTMPSVHYISTQSGETYLTHTDKNQNFLLSRMPIYRKDTLVKIKPSLTIPPDEIDHMIKGLFVQAAKALGRTSFHQLHTMLEKRFSPEFEKEMEEDKKKHGP